MSDTPASSSTKRFCTGCGVALPNGVRFCSACGTPAGGAPAGHAAQHVHAAAGGSAAPTAPTQAAPWIVAGLLTVVAVVAVIYAATDRTSAEPPAMGSAAPAGGALGATAAPDISNMTPREQFTRLTDRVTAAAEKGDTATVFRFTPMALGAYTNLPPGDRDIDARYHTAMIQAQVGMFPEALALADTMLKEAPNNLMGFFVQAIVGDYQGKKAEAEAARAAFRKHYDAEIAKKRDEYEAHRPLLENFKTTPGPK
ncbi:MAG: zinc ribbon domain-containing protein [Gemmatimonadetes bacterium]|nr:zinc ribbon domain-containing protein [Gemmatimonadota bacterium]